MKYYGDELAEIMMSSRAIFNPDKIVVASSQHLGKKDPMLSALVEHVSDCSASEPELSEGTEQRSGRL